MHSINQNKSGLLEMFAELPDFRNLGVCLRILLVVNVLLLCHAIVVSQNLTLLPSVFLASCSVIQPSLMLCIIGLYTLQPVLVSMPKPWAWCLVLGWPLLVANTVYQYVIQTLSPESARSIWHISAVTLMVLLTILYYFRLRRRALTPAITEARLQALQARIRPHFLFNCINAVLSIIRSEPRRAETALEDMADLFRVLMAENRDLVPLADEIGLCRQYLALEKLRLDERLHLQWQLDTMPPDTLIPPLILQPLIENAVYHGIEPMPEGGTLTIRIYGVRNDVHIQITNPYPGQQHHHHGNRMAINNIRERLSLHFDAEASLQSQVIDEANEQRYQVKIVIPYKGKSQ